MSEEIVYLTEEEVLFLNLHQINTYSPEEQRGIKDTALFQSALNRPKQSAFGEEAYVSIYEKAAALYESLAKNHSFHNANKRTAFASLYLFLRKNGFRLKVHPKKAEDFTVNMVAQKSPSISFEEISAWIETHTIRIEDNE